MSNDQFESILRPLAEEFAQKIAAAVTQQLQARVAHEVQAVMEQAFNGALQAAPAVVEAKPVAIKAEAKPTPTASSTCSQAGCPNNWYRPAGKDKKLCYAHFIAAGGKAPPGKKARAAKKGRKR
jgi:hypothetical protein